MRKDLQVYKTTVYNEIKVLQKKGLRLSEEWERNEVEPTALELQTLTNILGDLARLIIELKDHDTCL